MTLIDRAPKLKASLGNPARVRFAALFVFLMAAPGHFFSRAVPAAGPGDPTFRDFVGVNNMPGPGIAQQLGLGWVRVNFGWWEIEKQRGQWSWDGTDKLVQTAYAENLQVLPILMHTPRWAHATGRDTAPPDKVQDWEDYVEHVVARYSSSPYNLKYFQVWNEPTLQAAFYTGNSNLEWVDLIYLPAAKIIRRHGCYVVFGGWPLSNSLTELDQILSYHNAWQWTDIVDVHYRDISAWQHLYDQWVKTGKCRGLWQTEVGFTTAPNALPGTYLQGLHWALQAGWRDPDQYKIFWFAAQGSGADGPKCLLKSAGGNVVLTDHGKRLAVLNDLLGGGSLASFTNFSTSAPAMAGNVPTAVGFSVGARRIVIGLELPKATFGRQPSLQVKVSLSGQPRQTELVSVTGDRQALKGTNAGGRVQLNVPLQPVFGSCPTCAWGFAYVDIEE